jgi:hypothetical protein
MPAKFIIPFNNEPVSTQQGTTATYTVPAGKYARVTISASIGHSLSMTDATSGGAWATPATSINSVNETFEIWLYADQTLVLAASNTDASVSSNGTAITSAGGDMNAVGGVNITISSTLWRTIRCYSSAVVSCTTVSTGSATASLSTVSNFGWFAEEFNKLT